MTNAPRPPVKAADFATVGVATAMAYQAANLSTAIGKNSIDLQDVISRNNTLRSYIESAGLTVKAFAETYEVVDVQSPTGGSLGASVVAFKNRTTQSLLFGVAGVDQLPGELFHRIPGTVYLIAKPAPRR